jgi:hypothetical protein
VRARQVVLIFVACCVLAAVGAFVAARHFSSNLPLHLPVAEACTFGAADPTSSPSSASPSPGLAPSMSLDLEQSANAATIAAVGLRRGVPTRAITVALATALQESKLENLDHGDRDSIGLFQQRPSQGWGTPEQLSDPRYAAGAFYTRLLKVKGWPQLAVTDAAQAVQHSGHPGAYDKWADRAAIVARALSGETAGAVSCTLRGEPPTKGPAAAANLAASVKLDWGKVSTAPPKDFAGLALTVRNTTAGWQYAHWLVAHAEENAVKRVRFGGREWSAQTGAWAPVVDAGQPSGSKQVQAEVFAS